MNKNSGIATAVEASIYRNMYFSIYLFVLCVAVACRIYSVDASSLWADELWGVDACSQGSWWAMISNLIYKDSHPPGYQTMLYYWMQLFGKSDLVIRLPSVIAGVAAIVAVARFGTVFFSPLVGLLAATILAVSHNAIYYSQEARAYVFLMLFSVLYYHVFFQIFIRKEKAFSNWLSFWAYGALLAYFHYVGVVIVLAVALVVPFFSPKGSRISLFLKAFAPILLIYLPWAPVIFKHLIFEHPSWETVAPTVDTIVQTARFVLGPDEFRFFAGIFLLLIFLFSCGKGLFKRNILDEQKILLLLLLMSIMPVVAFYLKSHIGTSAYTIRHFSYLMPVFALVSAWSLALLIRWLSLSQSVAVWFIVGIISLVSIMLNVSSQLKIGGKLYSDFSKIEYRQAVETILLDKEFMQNKPRHVFISNKFFDHYIRFFDIKTRPAVYFHQNDVEKFPEYEKFISEKGVTDFYYLGIFQDVSKGEPSPVLRHLYTRYFTVCVTQFVWVQVVKFSTRLPPSGNQVVQNCPSATPVAAPVQ